MLPVLTIGPCYEAKLYGLKPNSITLSSWFGASSELATNMFGARSELASVMEFGFYCVIKNFDFLHFYLHFLFSVKPSSNGKTRAVKLMC